MRRLCLILATFLAACTTPSVLVNRAADELAGHGQVEEEDLGLARDAAPFYLKLSESVLKQTPGHGPLAAAVASGLTQYAYAFVSLEADKTQGRDAKAALQLRVRAARLYWRAHRHAMRALETQTPGFAIALAAGSAELRRDQVVLAYWAAASWGAAIALSKDQPEAVADLPLAVRLAQLAWHLEPAHGDGALSALVGTFEASRPNGQSSLAQRCFQDARAQGQGRNAGVLVAEAEALAAPAGDRAAYERLLREAVAVAQAHPYLANQVMRERAQWLLDTTDERF
jgi:hypothetical protein